MARKILHVDMDAFFASIEALRNGWENEPVVVCVYSGRTENSGAVSTCSYEARELGIHAAMPITKAQRIAENSDEEVHFTGVDKKHYREVSGQIRGEVLEHSAESIEPASIDEAYLKVEAEDFEEAEEMADKLRGQVLEKFNLTCSIGVGPNKLVAKMASDMDKPDGTTLVKPEEVNEFMESLELGDIHGIGSKTVEKLENLGIETVEALAEADPRLLVKEFGEKQGLKLRRKAKGRDNSEVKQEMKKQMAKIVTLDQNSSSVNHIVGHFPEILDQLMERVDRRNVSFGRVSLITVDTNLERYTRSRSLKARASSRDKIFEAGEDLLEKFLKEFDGEVRRVGLRVGDLKKNQGQKTLVRF